MEPSDEQEEKKKKKPDRSDLSELQDFNFAANWSESSPAPATRDRGASRGGKKGGPADRQVRPDRRRKASSHEGERSTERPDRRPPERKGGPGHRSSERRHEGPPPDAMFEVQVVPEEEIFEALTKRMRASLRTYELFEIARLILDRPERYHLSVRHKGDNDSDSPPSFFVSVPDRLPFTDEEGAVDHVLANHIESFFKTEEIEVDPPKGNFQYVMRCPKRGEVLGPPNFHRYQSILIDYHQRHFPDMAFEKFRSSLEAVRDEAAVQEWIERMKKAVRYIPLNKDGTEGESLQGIDQARRFLLRNRKDKAVRAVKTAKVAGNEVASVKEGKIRRALEHHIELQKRFPLDTANALRARLRRKNFYIYKKGSKGISYVCAVKRRFRDPDQVFSDSIQELIDFLEKNPLIYASALPEKHLGYPPAKPEEAGTESPSEAREADPRLKRLMIDLRWLLSEGFITEYSDGRLLVHPVAEVAKKREKPSNEKSAGRDHDKSSESTLEKPAEADSSGTESGGSKDELPSSRNGNATERGDSERNDSAVEDLFTGEAESRDEASGKPSSKSENP